MPKSSSSKVENVIHYGDITLDEEIVIHKYDYETMKIEKINMVQQAIEKKKHQEILKKEHRHKQALQDIKYIFLDAFNFPTPEKTQPLLEQMSDIVEKINNEDLDTNAKLLEWSKKKFQSKVNENISSEIALTQVALETKVEDVKKILENIFLLYIKVCNPTLFTQETRSCILNLESQISTLGTRLPSNSA